MRVTHPLLTRPDGQAGTQDTLMLPVMNGVIRMSFGFDEPWEAQPGEWRFDLVRDGELLASKTFMVTLPAPGTAPPACPGRGVS